MALQVTPYVALVLGAAILSVTLAVLIVRRRESSNINRTGLFLLFASTVWILGSAMEMASLDISGKIFWDKIESLGILMTPTGWFIYTIHYAKDDKWLTWPKALLLSIVPITFLLLVFSNSSHQLVWSSVRVHESLPNVELVKTNGPAFWFLLFYSYVLGSLAAFWLVQMLLRSRRLYRWKTLVLLLAAFIPWIVSIMEAFGIFPLPDTDSTALAIALVLPAFVWSMQHVGLGDLVPIARGTIIESMSDAVIVLDAGNRVADLNPTAEKLLGRTSSESIGQPVAQVWPEWQDLAMSNPFDSQSGREFVLGEDDLSRIYDIRVSPLVDYRGQLVSRVIVLRDISEHKEAETALRESEARYRLLAENSTDMISRYSPEGTLFYASPACRKLLGYEPEDLVGQKIFRYIHPHDRAEVRALQAKILNGSEDSTITCRLQRKDGSYIWVETTSRRLSGPTDKGGGPKEIISVTRNVTERKTAEEALATERERLTVTLQGLADGVIALDPKGRIMLANPVAEDQLKVLSDVGVGEILPSLGEHSREELLKSPSDGKLFHEITLKGISERTFEVIAQPMERSTKTGWVLVIRDVTKQRLGQQRIYQQERLAAVGQLAAGIAHDFNNIVGSIMLYSEMLLLAPELSSKDRERVATIIQQGERAATLTRQVLDFSRKAVMEQSPMALKPFLKEMEKLLARTLPENIQLTLNVGDEDYMVYADTTRMQQIFMNLGLNARDAMPEGGELRYDLSRIVVEPGDKPPIRDMEPGSWVRLSVSDSGRGIPPEVLPHIFEPFYTTKAPGEGSGLGLAQVYGIVKQHNGFIDVVSEQTHLTTFVIYLPALAASPKARVVQPEVHMESGQQETILVVEDDQATLDALRQILEAMNYRVLTASNGKEALTHFDENPGNIDLVLSDLVMPQMGGVALYRELKEKGLETKIMLMTGYPLGSGTRELLDHESVTWIQKPLVSQNLAESIRDVLTRQSEL